MMYGYNMMAGWPTMWGPWGWGIYFTVGGVVAGVEGCGTVEGGTQQSPAVVCRATGDKHGRHL